MATQPNKPTSKPVQSFQCGTVQAVIWKNTGKKGDVASVTLGRSYQDEADQWKTSDSFEVHDLSAVKHVVSQAEEWLRDRAK